MNQGPKKGLFGFGNRKKADEPKQRWFARFSKKKPMNESGDPTESHSTDVEATKPDERDTAAAETTPPPKTSLLDKLKTGLKKTRTSLGDRLGHLFSRDAGIDDSLLEEVEELLIGSDIGVQTSIEIIEKIRDQAGRQVLENGEQLKERLKGELLDILDRLPGGGLRFEQTPTIVLVVGVNGVGKTTTIGKIARLLQKQNKSVVVCAADTFRAAAVEQLQVWARRAGVDIVVKEGSKDPAAVVYDALERVNNQQSDVLIIDTAGRLHNNPNLMNELDKMKRIIEKSNPGAPHHVLLILDAVTGQNGLQQAKQFVAKVGVTDLILTKLDGTAKGGIAVAIARELKLPIQFIGVGEQLDDLLPFDRRAFVNSLFED